MACCAFIAFLISQIIVAWQAMQRLLGRTPVESVPAGMLWRLDMAQPMPATATASSAPAPFRWKVSSVRGWVLVVLLVELVVLFGGLQWFLFGDGRLSLADEFEQIARIRTLAELKDLCGYGRW